MGGGKKNQPRLTSIARAPSFVIWMFILPRVSPAAPGTSHALANKQRLKRGKTGFQGSAPWPAISYSVVTDNTDRRVYGPYKQEATCDTKLKIKRNRQLELTVLIQVSPETAVRRLPVGTTSWSSSPQHPGFAFLHGRKAALRLEANPSDRDDGGRGGS